MSGVQRAHATGASLARAAVLLILLFATTFPVEIRGEGDAPDPLAESAASFCTLFMDGEYERVLAMMSAKMQEAVTPAVAEQIRSSLTGENGALKHFGEVWMEDEVQGHRRYRVPAQFDKGTVDLRVVFDGEGKVAGFFYVPHEERPTERVSEGADTAVPAKGNPAVEGHWEGSIEIPGSPLTVIVDLAFAEGTWSGTFDSPLQGATGIPLEGIQVHGTEVRFSIRGIAGRPTFEGKLEGGEIRGTFSQMGQSFPFKLGRDEVALPARPQEPERPFPYKDDEVAYTNGSIRLAGTLTRPPGEGPFPAVLLISGSGPQNRDEEVFGHKPFLVLSDHLTRAGLAVLRYDDRGVGGSTGDLRTSTSEDFAGDALAGVDFLREQPEIDARRIGLIGHSEGAIVAPLVASRTEDVAFVVMLAGPGVPGDEVLARQMELLLRAGGVSEEKVKSVLGEQRRLLDLVLENAGEEKLLEPYRRLTEIQLASGSADVDPDELNEMALQGVKQVTSPWFRHFLAYDPRPALRQIKTPVLALNGELDLQVDPEQNLSEIRKALEAGGNPDFTVKELPGLNHLLQKTETGSVTEYALIEETVDPSALQTISDWILERFGG
jgi:pimeloyl-ACP methyl ester carboxylesterase